MKKILFLILICISLQLTAQHSISGTFSPADEYTWLIAYRLKPGTQVYVADTAIKNGEFKLALGEDAEPGTYRIVYAVPQEEYNFDILYNGKEDIIVDFDTDGGLGFTASQENIIVNKYLADLAQLESGIIEFYTEQKTDTTEFHRLVDKLKSLQNTFESNSFGLMANHFIMANKPYIPERFETVQEYVANKKSTYFDTLDFENPVLQSSVFLTEKAANYVFTALPLESTTKAAAEEAIINNIKDLEKYLNQVSADYKFHIFHHLWNTAVAYGYDEVSDDIYNNGLKDLVEETGNLEIKTALEAHNRLRLGEVAPEISWKNGINEKKLSTLEPKENYVLVFWSSTCGHCLKELPLLHKKLEGNPNVKVVAVGLEDESDNWAVESKNFPHFEHVISLGKWDSTYADLYDIHATPGYFILDHDKKIIAKPEDQDAVMEFLEDKK